MKIAVVTNGYPVGKSHMVSILKQAGHDVVFIDIEAMPTFNGKDDIHAVFVDEADHHVLNSFLWDDSEYSNNTVVFKNVARPDKGRWQKPVFKTRKPKPYFRKGERW